MGGRLFYNFLWFNFWFCPKYYIFRMTCSNSIDIFLQVTTESRHNIADFTQVLKKIVKFSNVINYKM